MSRRPSVAIVGAGSWGAALAREISRRGYRVDEILGRDNRSSQKGAAALARELNTRAAGLAQARFDADLIWLCVPDREIALVARQLARMARASAALPRAKSPGKSPPKSWKGKLVFHSSGALGSGELARLGPWIAGKASVHPMMSYVRGAASRFQGVFFGVEGDRSARRVAGRVIADLGGEMFVLRPEEKAAYHAWCTFLSPLLVGLLATAERVAQKAGVAARVARRRGLPLLRQTLENYAALGPAPALSGPTARGDAEVIGRHLETLADLGPAKQVYAAIEQATLRYLPSRNREAIESVLAAKSRTRPAAPRRTPRMRPGGGRKAPSR